MTTTNEKVRPKSMCGHRYVRRNAFGVWECEICGVELRVTFVEADE